MVRSQAVPAALQRSWRVKASIYHENRAIADNLFSLRGKPGLTVILQSLACLMAALLTSTACDRHDQAVKWGYDGQRAPEHWAELSEEYATCAAGGRQSPVDIAGYETGDAAPISFSYSGDAESVRNDGRFVHVDYAAGNTLTVGQRTFALKSAHFHSPSEHLIDGASFAAEMHLVHADADGNLAVVGLLFRSGTPSPVAQEILDAAPAVGDTVVKDFTLNSRGYVPDELGYYRYDGSKTTPPCDEPVDWYVMREPKSISPEQVDKLLALSGGPNNRPVQPVDDRVITIR